LSCLTAYQMHLRIWRTLAFHSHPLCFQGCPCGQSRCPHEDQSYFQAGWSACCCRGAQPLWSKEHSLWPHSRPRCSPGWLCDRSRCLHEDRACLHLCWSAWCCPIPSSQHPIRIHRSVGRRHIQHRCGRRYGRRPWEHRWYDQLRSRSHRGCDLNRLWGQPSWPRCYGA
jgi:hypothetical protein